MQINNLPSKLMYMFLFFFSFLDFMIWKEMEEKKEKSFYTVFASTVLKDGSKKTYYTCNRSGIYASQSTGTNFYMNIHSRAKTGGSDGMCPIIVSYKNVCEIQRKY